MASSADTEAASRSGNKEASKMPATVVDRVDSLPAGGWVGFPAVGGIELIHTLGGL